MMALIIQSTLLWALAASGAETAVQAVQAVDQVDDLIRVSGQFKQAHATADLLFMELDQRMKENPELRKTLSPAKKSELVQKQLDYVKSAYRKKFSTAELGYLFKMYKSEVGRKLVEFNNQLENDQEFSPINIFMVEMVKKSRLAQQRLPPPNQTPNRSPSKKP
jgi:hypothetical protein